MASCRLFIGNLPNCVTANQLHELFSQEGTVVDVFIPVDRDSRRPRGFALVEMANQREAAQAVENHNGKTEISEGRGSLVLENDSANSAEQFLHTEYVITPPLYERLWSEIETNPDALKMITPRQLEELIAELMELDGYNVVVTPKGGDGGVDIFATRKDKFMTTLTIVQCKHKVRNDKPIGEELVRAVYGALRLHKASNAMIATTGRFSKPASNLANQYTFELALKAYEDIFSWITNAMTQKPPPPRAHGANVAKKVSPPKPHSVVIVPKGSLPGGVSRIITVNEARPERARDTSRVNLAPPRSSGNRW